MDVFCPNCGAEVDPNAVVCVKCGVALKKTDTTSNQPAKSGAATASMVLGIIAIVFAVITFFIAGGISVAKEKSLGLSLYANTYQSEMIATAIGVVFLPGILSIIGFILALASRGKVKNSANSAGLALNIITIILCVIQFMMITG